MRSARPLKILMSYAAPGPTSNPFTRHLSEGLSRSVEVHHLSTRALLWGRFDLIHVHWPENFFRASGTLRNAIKTFCGVLFMLRVELLRIPIVYTRHNIAPHEQPGWLYGALYRWIDHRVTARVYLNESTQNDPTAGVTVLHGDYPKSAMAPNSDSAGDAHVTILFFGLLRRYKGLETLFEAFAATSDSRFRLRVCGSAADDDYVAELAALAAVDDRITFHPRFLQESELELEIERADLVVLPYFAIYNSGAAILALSRDRPVLAPYGPSTRTLQAEVGSSFVRLFRGPLTALDITEAVVRRPNASSAPDLSRRSWPEICELHTELYRLIVRNRGQSRRALKAAVRHGVAADNRFVRHSLRNTLVVGVDDVRV